MTASDGKRQRNALTAAESALRAVAAGEASRAVRNAARAAELDQVGAFTALPDAVASAVRQLEHDGAVSAEGWDGLAAAVGDGPLGFLVEELRG